jgi:hypothetical protein
MQEVRNMPADPSKAGKIGGKSRSAAKLAAARRNGFQKVTNAERYAAICEAVGATPEPSPDLPTKAEWDEQPREELAEPAPRHVIVVPAPSNHKPPKETAERLREIIKGDVRKPEEYCGAERNRPRTEAQILDELFQPRTED